MHRKPRNPLDKSGTKKLAPMESSFHKRRLKQMAKMTRKYNNFVLLLSYKPF
jgi:hypothetical protein